MIDSLEMTLVGCFSSSAFTYNPMLEEDASGKDEPLTWAICIQNCLLKGFF